MLNEKNIIQPAQDSSLIFFYEKHLGTTLYIAFKNSSFLTSIYYSFLFNAYVCAAQHTILFCAISFIMW